MRGLVLVFAICALVAPVQRVAADPAGPLSVSAAKAPFVLRGFSLLRDLAIRQPNWVVQSFTLTRGSSAKQLGTLIVYVTPYWATRGSKTLRDRPGYFVTGHAYRVGNVVLYVGSRVSPLGASLFPALETLGKPVQLW